MEHFSPDMTPPQGVIGAGIGLKPQHYHDIRDTSPDIGWFEIHAENYMGDGGAPHHYLSQIVMRYPLSIHGVGLSIGGHDPLDKAHLQRLKKLNDRYQPALFSEHLAWSSHGGTFYNDLLPLPYSQATLETVCGHISQLQDVLGRQILLENPSTYIAFADNHFSEPDFLAKIADKTGCGLLLDVNNVYVSAQNNDFDPMGYIIEFPLADVREIHLAGHETEKVYALESGDEGDDEHETLFLIDDHGSPVTEQVWQLYEYTLSLAGAVPTLIERDHNIPSLAELTAEAQIAATLMQKWEKQDAPAS